MVRSIIFLFGLACYYTVNAQRSKLQLDTPNENMKAYLKARGSLDSAEEVVFYDEGYIYIIQPEKPVKAAFKFQMYNIARFVSTDSGVTQLSREMLVYEDLTTGQVIDTWYNSITKDSVDVLHVWNDPVNAILKKGRFSVDYVRMDNGRICFNIDLPLFYPSPLKKKDWPESSRSDMYQAMEMFQFFVNERELLNKKKKNITCDISWTRISDFLPWMKMGDQPGYLIFSSRGWKLKDGWQSLPQPIKDLVMQEHPEYQHAPLSYTSPNMTSWKYYKKYMETGKN
jgi:hypothetical protein